MVGCGAAASGEHDMVEAPAVAEPKMQPRAEAQPAQASADKPAKDPTPATAPMNKNAAGKPSLRVEIRDDSGQALTTLNVDCSGNCLAIEAAATGGNEPYVFTWDDGSHEPKRQVCPSADTHITLEARDTAQMTAEFAIEAQRASAQLELRVQGCASVAENAVKACRAAPPARCDLGDGIVLPENLTVDVANGTIQYYAHGAALPPGRYQLSYVDGCATFGGLPNDGLNIGWTVNGQNTMPGVWGCYLAGADGAAFAVAPGTTGTFAGPSTEDGIGGAFMTYAECVEANCDLPAIELDFPGGKLGVGRDGGGIGSVDDLGGEAEGGVSPTFRLYRKDGCR